MGLVAAWALALLASCGGSGAGTGGSGTGESGGTGGVTNPGIQFRWLVDGAVYPAPDFVNSPGPAATAARNSVSRFPISSHVSLLIYRRMIPDTAAMWIEAGFMNDPLITTAQPFAGAAVSSELLPDVQLEVAGGRLLPLFPQLATFKPVLPEVRYRLTFPQESDRFVADGAGHIWPFVATTETSLGGSWSDLSALFPANPGCMWASVDPTFPSRSNQEMAWLNGSTLFPTTGDPWGLLGVEEKETWTTGYHGDWPFCHIGAYYARNELQDLMYIAPTVYRQSARPAHYDGFIGSVPSVWLNNCRPAPWGTEYLGRIPVRDNPNKVAPVADDHGWTAQDHQHGSLRRTAEFAEATGSPWAWAETLHHGELAKAMLRTIDPAPYGQGYANTPRGYLGWLEIAYRAWRLNPSYDMSQPIAVMEHFLDLGHAQPYGKPYGQPQVMWAQISNTWIPGHYAAASFEDLRAVPILLKVGTVFSRPKFIFGALEKCQFYATQGWTDGAEGKGKGIKRLVDPLDPNNFVDADLSDYNRVSGLGMYLAAKFLETNNFAGFDGPRYLEIAAQIKADAKTKLNWSDIARYLPY